MKHTDLIILFLALALVAVQGIEAYQAYSSSPTSSPTFVPTITPVSNEGYYASSEPTDAPVRRG